MNGKVEITDEPLTDEDWKARYEEVCETLADAEAELAEFQQSSKELEEEMGLEVERAEKDKEAMKNKLLKVENEREDWKTKFMNLQGTHTKTVNSLQRELEALRENFRITKVQLRDLEMGNDDLERHERAVLSSLEDLEGKYSRALEEKILLEHELQDKASMEEAMQRLRDELRDATSEVSVLRTQLSRAETIAPKLDSPPLDDLELLLGSDATSQPTPESLLEVPLPSDDLQLSDLVAEPQTPIEREADIELTAGQSALLARAGFASPTAGLKRSTTLPSITSSPSRLPAPSPRRPLSTNISNAGPSIPMRQAGTRTMSNATTASTLAARSKGMQMVSDMRSRVKTLEQRLQSRVPRIGKGTIRPPEAGARFSGERERPKAIVESPGWVLVTQEPTPSKPSPQPRSDNGTLSPPPSSFRPGASTSALRPPSRTGNLGASQNHLSASTSSTRGVSRTPSRSSKPPTSHAIARPVTPTLLPVPAGSDALKRSTRRSSLGASASLHPPPSRTRPGSTTMPPRPPLPSMQPPPPPGSSTNGRGGGTQLPTRPGSSLGMSTRNALSQSKIGRPTSLTALPRSGPPAE